MKVALLLLSLIVASPAWARLTLPKNLNAEDRKEALGILGYGSKSKILSSPVPLGGQEGFEVGISSEYIPITDLRGLGSGTSEKDELDFRVLTLGKGLVHNIDTFFHMTPLPQKGIFGYGAHLRWGFWEAKRLPAVLSFIPHASGMNYDNELSTRTVGTDLVMTIALDQMALYFGGGPIRTIGTFSGGPSGLTAEGDAKDTDLSDLHSVFGLNVAFQNIHLTMEVDRVLQSTYAARLSYRF